MKIKQIRAIFYADRGRKLKKIEALGLLQEYQDYKGNSRYHKIALFSKKKGISL